MAEAISCWKHDPEEEFSFDDNGLTIAEKRKKPFIDPDQADANDEGSTQKLPISLIRNDLETTESFEFMPENHVFIGDAKNFIGTKEETTYHCLRGYDFKGGTRKELQALRTHENGQKRENTEGILLMLNTGHRSKEDVDDSDEERETALLRFQDKFCEGVQINQVSSKVGESGNLKETAYKADLESPIEILRKSMVSIWWNVWVSITIGMVLGIPIAGVQGALTVTPENIIGAVGSSIRLRCSTASEKPVYWDRTPVGSDQKEWLYYGKNGFNGHNADGRFAIEKDEFTGRYDLVISNVQWKDAGTYGCVDESGLGIRSSAELIISNALDCKEDVPTDGVMGYNVFEIDEILISMTCSLNFIGNRPPSLNWTWPGSKEHHGDAPIVTRTSSFVTSTLKLTPKPEHNNVAFQCWANSPSADSKRFPREAETYDGLWWKSSPVFVKYALFESTEIAECPGVKWNLVCNPKCSYYFEKTNDCVCRCRYTYYNGQEILDTTSDDIACEPETNPNSDKSIVLIAVVAATALALLIISVTCGLLLVKIKKNGTWCRLKDTENYDADKATERLNPNNV